MERAALRHLLSQGPPRRIRRFQCLHCHVAVGCQTFNVVCWLERPDIMTRLRRRVWHELNSSRAVRNDFNGKRERGCRQTPAQLLDVCRERLTARAVVARRLFFAQVGPEGRWCQHSWQEVEAGALKINRRRRLPYAA